MVAVSDFSGLMSSAWALAKAEARAATDSLDRGMARLLRLQHVKAHRPRFRTLGFHAMPDGLLGILGHQSFEFAFGPFVVEKGMPAVSEERGELRPGIRRTHIDDADGLNARPRRLGVDEMWDFAGLHAAPELLFRRDQDAEIERIHGDRDLDPLAAPVMIDSTEVLKWVTHMLCWTWAMYFSAAASSENDQGSMNLASNIASVSSMMPSRVAAIHGMAECLTRRWMSVTRRPVLRSYQERLSSSVAAPSCTTKLPDRPSGFASPRFSRQSCIRAVSLLPMMMRASEPPMKVRRPSVHGCLLWSICKPYYYLFQSILYIKCKYREVKQFKIN